MSEDKHLEKREKLEAEIERSLTVVKVKEAHKQIEDIEKLRKQASIRSISERVSFCTGLSKGFVDSITEIMKEDPSLKLDWKLKDNGFSRKMVNTIMAMYESIRFDLQRTIDIKKEDFDRLFPKTEYDFATYGLIAPNLLCLNMQLTDMKNYCKRLL